MPHRPKHSPQQTPLPGVEPIGPELGISDHLPTPGAAFAALDGAVHQAVTRVLTTPGDLVCGVFSEITGLELEP